MDAGKKTQPKQRLQNRQNSGKMLNPDQKQQIKEKWNTLDPNQKQQVKQKAKEKWNSRPVNRPGEGNRPIHGKPDHSDGHYGHHPHHGHHGHHHHYHHYPYYGWGGYWPWFWGSAIAVGAIVSTIPDDECKDIYIDGKQYKECEGVLFEPVYKGNDVQYEVVEINK